MEDDSRDDWPMGPQVRRSFEDRLLLAILDGHPTCDREDSEARKEEERERRLKSAKNALFGTQENLLGRQEHVDLRALRWMGAEYYRDKAFESMRRLSPQEPKWQGHKTRSIRALAEDAAKKFYPNIAGDVSERLRKKFSKEREYWLEVARIHDDVPETIETSLLDRILELLKQGGVSCVPNWPSGEPRKKET
jgi:hypothetical protein